MQNKDRFFTRIGLLIMAATFLTWPFSGSMVSAEQGDWPQWRGPNRDGISDETGILKSWPKDGLKVLWRVPIGDGYSGISISQGRLYTMEAEDEGEFVTCLEASSGKEVWRFRTDAKFYNDRGDGPRSAPTVDGNQVFALGASGKLYALDAETGEKLWGHDFVEEFGSGIPGWGFSSSPIVEGNLVLVEAGGKDGKSIVAFDKKSGDVQWTTHTDEAGYSSPIAITFNGIRQIIFLTPNNLVSVSPTDGQIYWKYHWPEGINIATPVFIKPDKIFVSCSYDKGSVLVKIDADGDKFGVEEVWKSKVMKNHFNSSVLQGEYLYGFDNAILKCIKADTGEEQWKHRGFGKGSLLLADGHLIILGEKGKLGLVEATPKEYEEKANFQLFKELCWTVPTLVDGKLYVRHQKEMVCLDIKAEMPKVGGNWTGTWGVSGAPKEYQQRLDCRVVALGADQWEATFEGECGRPYKYTIQMLGTRAGDVVLFKGSADLGEKDGGVYDWIGRAAEDKFVGFYTSQKYTGTFEMTRSEEIPNVTSADLN